VESIEKTLQDPTLNSSNARLFFTTIKEKIGSLLAKYDNEKNSKVVKNEHKPVLIFLNNDFIEVFSADTLKKLQKVNHGVSNMYTAYSKCVFTRSSRYFITGSYYKPGNCTYEFEMESMQLVKKADMQDERCNHAFVEVKNDFLLAISGPKTSQCEIYNVQTDSWRRISPLNHRRRDHMALVFQQYTVYVFGGLDNRSGPITLCERIKLDNRLTGQWNMLRIKSTSKEVPIYFQSCLQVSVADFLIFGGHDLSGTGTNKCLLFNAKTANMKTTLWPMKKQDNFQGAAITIQYNGKHYAISTRGNLHIFNKGRWEAIENFIDDK